MWHLVNSVARKYFTPIEGRHCAYWNDGFFVANRFGLDEHFQKQSAIVALWNGRHKYFEWLTHSGFDNAKLLDSIGIISTEQADDFRKEQKERGYVGMPKEVYIAVRDHFRLTTQDLESAKWICQTVWEKEQNPDKGSGQYDRLPVLYAID